MTRALAIARRDLAGLWTSPVPWVAGALLHALLGLLYIGQLEVRRQAVLQPIFPILGFLLVAVVPVLTMRSIAEEARTGTLDLLEAVPVPAPVVVAGKWLAAWLTTVAITFPAAVHVGILHWLGDPDPGPVIAGSLGVLLFAAALCGVGVLASSLSSSQPVAGALAFGALLVLWFAHVGSESIITGSVLAHLSLSERLRSFAAGAVELADVAYLVAASGAALALAALRLDARRLR